MVHDVSGFSTKSTGINNNLYFDLLNTFILAVIVQKPCDTQPGVVGRHLIQNLSNFYHIFSLYTATFPPNFNSLGFFVKVL